MALTISLLIQTILFMRRFRALAYHLKIHGSVQRRIPYLPRSSILRLDRHFDPSHLLFLPFCLEHSPRFEGPILPCTLGLSQPA